VGFFGDGSLEEGLVLESFNLAALWKLPVVYVCENNSAGAIGAQQGGYSTATTAVESFTRLPAAYGIHTMKVDGTDMAAVYSAACEAVQRCRAGIGPVFVEAFTLRWPGSGPLWPELATIFDLDQAWDSALITGAHEDWIRDHDPLLLAAREIVAQEFATPEQLKARDRAARERIAAAASFAIESPMPAPETSLTGVFA
jgi:TPP-dependent pyruvate/acetoin dehydrogenase alpha subunit